MEKKSYVIYGKEKYERKGKIHESVKRKKNIS
jgi:hypothetical protein